MILAVLLLAMAAPALAQEDAVCGYYNPQVPPPLPAVHEATGDEYFADAVLVGDSIMESLEMYDLFPTANIVCRSGISPRDANWRLFPVRGVDHLLNLYEMVAYYNPAKIYILLGGNSLDNMNSADSLAIYEKMLDEMIRRFPSCLIYVIAPPSQVMKALIDQGIPAGRYRNFRDGLLEMAEAKHVYFIDYFAPMVDQNGCMLEKYDSGDGAHPTKGGLQVLENLIRTQTVAYQ